MRHVWNHFIKPGRHSLQEILVVLEGTSERHQASMMLDLFN
jgi:hypothetical protein